MRLIQYLTEKDYEPDEVMKLLKKGCQPWIKKSNSNLAYRGMKGQPNFLKKKVRTDRRPLDTPQDISDAFDVVAKKKFGWKPRSEGMFCVGLREVAKYYGLVYSVWPIGAFKFIWSPDVEDFNNLYEDEEDLDMKDIISTYTNKNLEEAIRNGGEIMVKCKEYYAVSNNFLDLGWWASQGCGKWD